MTRRCALRGVRGSDNDANDTLQSTSVVSEGIEAWMTELNVFVMPRAVILQVEDF